MAASMMSSSLAGSSYFGSNVRQQAAFSTRRVAPVSVRVVAGWGKQPKIGPGKRWEKPELTANYKVVRTKMHVKSGDTVIVSATACPGGRPCSRQRTQRGASSAMQCCMTADVQCSTSPAAAHPPLSPPSPSHAWGGVAWQVIAGKDKGTVAEVEKVDTSHGLITVKGVNIKASRGSATGGGGGGAAVERRGDSRQRQQQRWWWRWQERGQQWRSCTAGSGGAESHISGGSSSGGSSSGGRFAAALSGAASRSPRLTLPPLARASRCAGEEREAQGGERAGAAGEEGVPHPPQQRHALQQRQAGPQPGGAQDGRGVRQEGGRRGARGGFSWGGAGGARQGWGGRRGQATDRQRAAAGALQAAAQPGVWD